MPVAARSSRYLDHCDALTIGVATCLAAPKRACFAAREMHEWIYRFPMRRESLKGS